MANLSPLVLCAGFSHCTCILSLESIAKIPSAPPRHTDQCTPTILVNRRGNLRVREHSLLLHSKILGLFITFSFFGF